jgi:hypothetical protein
MVGTWFLDQFRDCDLNGDVVVNQANDSVQRELLSLSNTNVWKICVNVVLEHDMSFTM